MNPAALFFFSSPPSSGSEQLFGVASLLTPPTAALVDAATALQGIIDFIVRMLAVGLPHDGLAALAVHQRRPLRCIPVLRLCLLDGLR